MKPRIISLLLSFILLSILTLQSLSHTVIFENSPITIVEHVLEERLADKFVNDTDLHHCMMKHLFKEKKSNYHVEQDIYNFKLSNTPFRPPITA